MPTPQLEPAKAAGNPSKSSMLFKAMKLGNTSQRNQIKIFGPKHTLDVSTVGLLERDNTSLDTPKANQITTHKFIDLTQENKKRPQSNIEVNNDILKSKTGRTTRIQNKHMKKQNNTSRNTEEPSKIFKEVTLIKTS
jgi:hypothetical protein